MRHNKLNTILIGAGRVGILYDYKKKNEFYTHANSVLKSKYYKLAGIFDKNKKNFQKVKKKFNLNLLSLSKIKSIKYDTAIISVSTQDHYAVFNEVIKNKDLKVIIIEKPCTYNLFFLQKIIKVCLKKDISLFINYYRNFSNYFDKIKSIIKKNGKNKIIINYNNGIYNNLSHFLSLIIDIHGYPKSFFIFKKIKIGKHDYNANLEIKFQNAEVIANYNFNKKNSNCEILIYGNTKLVSTQQFNQFKIFKHSKDNISGSRVFSEKGKVLKNLNIKKYQLEAYNKFYQLHKNRLKLKIKRNNDISLIVHKFLNLVKNSKSEKRIFLNK